jgi:hypothetical protein
MQRKFAFILTIIIGMPGTPGETLSIELGLTPSNVFVLWTNVNDALIAVAETSSGNAEGSAGIAAMTPNRFQGKKSAVVLKKVAAFREKLDLLRQKSGLKPIKFNAFEAGDTDGTSKRQARNVCMTRKLTERPFENGQTEKVGPSDGRRGNAVPLVAESNYDFRELGAYLGKVG